MSTAWWTERIRQEENRRLDHEISKRGVVHLLGRSESATLPVAERPGMSDVRRPRPGRPVGTTDHGTINPFLHDLHRLKDDSATLKLGASRGGGDPSLERWKRAADRAPASQPPAASLHRPAAQAVHQAPSAVSVSAPSAAGASSTLQRAALQEFMSWPPGGFRGPCHMDLESAVTTTAPSLLPPSLVSLGARP